MAKRFFTLKVINSHFSDIFKLGSIKNNCSNLHNDHLIFIYILLSSRAS